MSKVTKPKWISIKDYGYPSVEDTYPHPHLDDSAAIARGEHGYRMFLLKNEYTIGTSFYGGKWVWDNWEADEPPTHYAIIEGF